MLAAYQPDLHPAASKQENKAHCWHDLEVQAGCQGVYVVRSCPVLPSIVLKDLVLSAPGCQNVLEDLISYQLWLQLGFLQMTQICSTKQGSHCVICSQRCESNFKQHPKPAFEQSLRETVGATPRACHLMLHRQQRLF